MDGNGTTAHHGVHLMTGNLVNLAGRMVGHFLNKIVLFDTMGGGMMLLVQELISMFARRNVKVFFYYLHWIKLIHPFKEILVQLSFILIHDI